MSGSPTNPSSETNTPEQRVPLPPPPEETFQSYDLCWDAIKTWAGQNGYDLSKGKRSKKNSDGVIYRWTLQCTRGGHLDNKRKLQEKDRVRLRRSSKKTGCPMGVIIVATDPDALGGSWEVRHQQEERSRWHNHKAASASVLPGHRRRQITAEAERTIRLHREAGIRPFRTLVVLRQALPDSIISKKDIDNIQNNMRREMLGSSTVVEKFMEKAQEREDDFFRFSADAEGRIERFLFVPNEGLQLLNKHPEVFLLDCTYRTNLYNKPLLDIIGVGPNHHSFQVF